MKKIKRPTTEEEFTEMAENKDLIELKNECGIDVTQLTRWQSKDEENRSFFVLLNDNNEPTIKSFHIAGKSATIGNALYSIFSAEPTLAYFVRDVANDYISATEKQNNNKSKTN